MTNRQARTALAAVRAAVGAGALVTPRLTGRIFGIDVAVNPALPFVARLFGARELFMAGPQLLDPDGDHADLHRLAMGVDCLDALAAVAAVGRGALPKNRLLLFAGGLVAAIALGSKASEPDAA